MRLSEKVKETMVYAFLLGVLCFMMFSCNTSMLSKRRQTEDEKQMKMFKEQIKLKQYYYASLH